MGIFESALEAAPATLLLFPLQQLRQPRGLHESIHAVMFARLTLGGNQRRDVLVIFDLRTAIVAARMIGDYLSAVEDTHTLGRCPYGELPPDGGVCNADFVGDYDMKFDRIGALLLKYSSIKEVADEDYEALEWELHQRASENTLRKRLQQLASIKPLNAVLERYDTITDVVSLTSSSP